jgi:hypothetical protein
MTPPTRPGMTWNAIAHRWEPEGKVWDPRRHLWVDEPTVPLPPEPEPEGSAGPRRGPRYCPQRRCNKKVLKGPRARQPLRSGQHAPKVSTLPPRRH